MDSDESKLRNFQGLFQDHFFFHNKNFHGKFHKTYIHVMANIVKFSF